MIHKVPCPHCKGTLYEIVRFDDPLQTTRSVPAPLRPADESVTCPHCGRDAQAVKTIGPHAFPLFKAA